MDLANLYRRGEYATVAREAERLREEGPAEEALTAAVTWYYGALANYRLGKMLPSVSLMERAVEEAEVAGDPVFLGKVRFQAGGVYRRAGRVSEALHFINLFLSDLDRYPNLSAYVGAAHYNLGLAYRQFQDLEQSIEHYRQAEAIFRERGDIPLLLRTLNNLAFVLVEAGRHEEAEDCLQRSATVLRTLDDNAERMEFQHGSTISKALLFQRTGYAGTAMGLCHAVVSEDSGASVELQAWATWIAAESALDMHETKYAELLVALASRLAIQTGDTRMMNYLAATRRRIVSAATA